MSEFNNYHTQNLPPEWGGPVVPGYAGGVPPVGHNAVQPPTAGWGGNMAPVSTGGHDYAPAQPWAGGAYDQTPGWASASSPDTYVAQSPHGGSTGWNTLPSSGSGGNQYVAPPTAEATPRRQGLISRLRGKMGGNASYGVVNAAPEVAPPSPWGAPGAEPGYSSPSAMANHSAEQTAAGWGIQPAAGYRFDQSAPLPSGSFAETSGYTPDRFRQGVQGFRGLVEQAGGAAQVTGHKAAELWGKTPEPVKVVAGAAGEAAAASFLSNYGVYRNGEGLGWDVNRRELATSVVKTALLPGSTAQLANQGRAAFKAGRTAGRNAAIQQARQAVQNL